jgi:uncharacterized protein (DUF433 family)
MLQRGHEFTIWTGFLSFVQTFSTMHRNELLDRISTNPAICGGRPIIRGMRIRVTDVLDLLAEGLSPEQIVEELPDLELEDIKACLVYVSRRFDHPVITARLSQE